MKSIDLYYCYDDIQYVFVLSIWEEHPLDHWDDCAKALKLYSLRLFNMMNRSDLKNEKYISSVIIEDG